MELSQESAAATPTPDRPLRDEIAEVIYGTSQECVERPWDPEWSTPSDLPVVNDAFDTADQVMNLLNERGHYLPGAPPAAVILQDAKTFAERLTLSNLALRAFAMLGSLSLDTPETQPAKRWIVDYIEGKNHGPVGYPMLWPAQLPGLAHMLREWGFEPTPTVPAYVARALPNPTMQ